MLRNALLVAAVVWIVVLGACGPSDLPAVSTPDPSLDEGDRAVMIAVLDDFLRPQRDKEIRRSRGNDPASSPTPARFLMFDATVPVCAAHPILSGDRLPGCMQVWTVRLVRFMPPFLEFNTAALMPQRMAPVTSQFVPNVIPVRSTVMVIRRTSPPPASRVESQAVRRML
jgi:hypothetical protein